MSEARDDLDRFDRVLGSAEAISGAVAGGSRVARAALSAAGDQDGRPRHRHHHGPSVASRPDEGPQEESA